MVSDEKKATGVWLWFFPPLPSLHFHSDNFMSSHCTHTSAVSDVLFFTLSCCLSLVNWLYSSVYWISSELYIWHCSCKGAATNSLLIYIMTVERQIVLSGAHWRGSRKSHGNTALQEGFRQNQINSTWCNSIAFNCFLLPDLDPHRQCNYWSQFINWFYYLKNLLPPFFFYQVFGKPQKLNFVFYFYVFVFQMDSWSGNSVRICIAMYYNFKRRRIDSYRNSNVH